MLSPNIFPLRLIRRDRHERRGRIEACKRAVQTAALFGELPRQQMAVAKLEPRGSLSPKPEYLAARWARDSQSASSGTTIMKGVSIITSGRRIAKSPVTRIAQP